MDSMGDELRRKAVAASTIREALGEWHEREMLRLISLIAKSPSTLPDLLAIQAECKASYKLFKELESAMNRGSSD